METEIKLLLDPSARPAVESHPLFAGKSGRNLHLVSTYFDTPDLGLRRQGASLRVRRSGKRFIQTVKLIDAPGLAPSSRGEWEWPVASDAVDPTPIAGEAAVRGLFEGVLGAVEPVFVTDIRRTTWRFDLEGDTGVEAAIDEGVVRAGDRQSAICEVELELKGGPPAPLFRLAADLAARAALRLGPESKAERGYGLLTGTLPPERGPTELVFDPAVGIGQAFPAMAAAALRGFVADLPAAGRGDREGIHRLRAAVRKLRSLLVLFAPHLEATEAERFNAKLRAFGAVLGGARDWDVFDAETCAAAADDIGPEAASGFRAAAAEPRARAHEAIRTGLAGPLPTELALGLLAWTAGQDWLRDARFEDRLRERLPRLLDALLSKVRKRGRHLRGLDADALHDLRKAMKKLRYAAEDTASLFKPRATRVYLKRCKAVLEVLGGINDAAVTVARVERLEREHPSELADAAPRLLAWNAARRRRNLGELRGPWRRFQRASRFWD